MATPRDLRVRIRSKRREEFFFRQSSRRLVQDQQLQIFGERASDHDELLRRQVQPSHFPAGVQVELEIAERRPRFRQPRADVDKTPSRRLVVETDIFCDAHLRDDADFLRDKDYSRLLRCGGVGGTIIVPAELNSP